MKQTFLTPIITAALLMILFFRCNSFQERQLVNEYKEASLNNSIAEHFEDTKKMAEGTPYNIDSLKRLVFDTIENGYQKLGVLANAQDSIKLKYKQASQ